MLDSNSYYQFPGNRPDPAKIKNFSKKEKTLNYNFCNHPQTIEPNPAQPILHAPSITEPDDLTDVQEEPGPDDDDEDADTPEDSNAHPDIEASAVLLNRIVHPPNDEEYDRVLEGINASLRQNRRPSLTGSKSRRVPSRESSHSNVQDATGLPRNFSKSSIAASNNGIKKSPSQTTLELR